LCPAKNRICSSFYLLEVAGILVSDRMCCAKRSFSDLVKRLLYKISLSVGNSLFFVAVNSKTLTVSTKFEKCYPAMCRSR